MRIVGGTFKRRIITPPKNLPVRPTTDLAKESLFNILGNIVNLNDKTVADLFSGTGNIAYEFVSRGAEKVLAVEQHFACVKFIRQTAHDFEMNQLTVIQSDVFRFLKTGTQVYDVILQTHLTPWTIFLKFNNWFLNTTDLNQMAGSLLNIQNQ